MVLWAVGSIGMSGPLLWRFTWMIAGISVVGGIVVVGLGSG
jgi:hypothetical protein